MQFKSKNFLKAVSLLELSVVIVIIGLLVGGFVLSNDIIKNSRITSLISQMQQLNQSSSAFESLYGYLPGDYELASYNIDSSLTDGDGNGYIVDTDGSPTSAPSSFTKVIDSVSSPNEIVSIFHHLSVANFISADFDGVENKCQPGENIPLLKTGFGGLIYYTSFQDNKNYWHLGVGYGTTDAIVSQNILSPAQAFGIDNKLDDGEPMRGLVQVVAAIDDLASYTGDADFDDAACINLNSAARGDTAAYKIHITSNECQLRVALE